MTEPHALERSLGKAKRIDDQRSADLALTVSVVIMRNRDEFGG